LIRKGSFNVGDAENLAIKENPYLTVI